jgi:hypothetical protein
MSNKVIYLIESIDRESLFEDIVHVALICGGKLVFMSTTLIYPAEVLIKVILRICFERWIVHVFISCHPRNLNLRLMKIEQPYSISRRDR